jgi:NADPH-dependent F420 reductase
MRIALLGGTGDIGEGLAIRWARDTDHTVHIGSRDPEKAHSRAEDYREALSERGFETSVEGSGNEAAAAAADVVVVSVPPQYAADTVDTVADGLESEDIVVSPAVSMDRDEAGFHYERPEAGSVAEEIASAAPEDVPVVGAFQNLAAGALTDLDNDLEYDVVVTGNDPEARETVQALAEEIEGIRALIGGPLAVSGEIEGITPLLINLAMNNDGMHDLGVQFK